MALLGMYSAGAVTAPFDGSVSSIDYSDKTTSSSDKKRTPPPAAEAWCTAA